MTARVRVFISHTHHDPRDHALARSLADGLQAHADVYIAPESIPAGADWEVQIGEEILLRCTHFLVIVSAAATESDWVIREIQLAQKRRRDSASLTILPLVVGQLDAFVAKVGLAEYQRVPYSGDLDGQVRAVLTAVGLGFSPAPTQRTLIEEKSDGFVGRTYVFGAVRDFIDRQSSGYFILEGDPGAGKTAILAKYVRDTNCLYHFNVRSLGVTTASQFLESLCSQLHARLGKSSALPNSATEDGAYLVTLLEEEAANALSDLPLVVAVDALDEVDLSAQRRGSNVLYLPSEVPDGVFFFLTLRRALDIPLTVHASQQVLDLSNLEDESSVDVREYIRNRMDRPEAYAWAESRGLSREHLVHVLTVKSENNFMYLRYVLSDLLAGKYQQRPLEDLPVGLSGYYEDHWSRMGMATRPLPTAKLHIVYILAEVESPVSRSFIAHLAKRTEAEVQDVLDEWNQFLHRNGTESALRYSIYHHSFREFLHRKDIVQAAGISIEGIHASISDDLWEELFTD